MLTCPHCGIAIRDQPPTSPDDQPLDSESARQLQRIEAELARVKAAIQPQTAPVPIEDLKLSTRANNALKRVGVHTLATLLTYSSFDLLDIRNFGTGSLGEVQLALHLRGLALRKERLLPRTRRGRGSTYTP
jgi:DNA-directed RNA polymerase alpha subunit